MSDIKKFTFRLDLDRREDRALYEWLHRMTKDRSLSVNAFVNLILNRARLGEEGQELFSATVTPSKTAEGSSDTGDEIMDVPDIPDEAMDFMDAMNMV